MGSGLSPAAMTRRPRSGRRHNRSRLPRGKKKSERQPKNWKTSRRPVRRAGARADGPRPSRGDQAMAVLITSKRILRTDSVSLVAASNGDSFVRGKNSQVSCNLSSALEQEKVNGENATPQIKIYECKTALSATGFSST